MDVVRCIAPHCITALPIPIHALVYLLIFVSLSSFCQFDYTHSQVKGESMKRIIANGDFKAFDTALNKWDRIVQIWSPLDLRMNTTYQCII